MIAADKIEAALALLDEALTEAHGNAGTHRTVHNTGGALFSAALKEALEAYPALRAVLTKGGF